jgi:hypothetical protein
MAVDLTLKSTAITNREASPRVDNNPGAGAITRVHRVYGYIASVTAALSATSVIRLVEVPSNAIVTSVKITSGAQTAGKFNIGVYRKPQDGGLVAFTASDSFFTTDLDCAAAVIDQECVMKATSANTLVKRNQPLWQAIGMASDPKTGLDICATVHTTDVTTGTGALGCVVDFAV